MPIRFRCPSCSQPIEVDADLAGKMARCPYCERVAAVPTESTLDAGPIATARPAGVAEPTPVGAPPPPPPPPLMTPAGGFGSLPPTPAMDPRASRMGNFALVAAGICGTLFVVAVVRYFLTMMRVLEKMGFSATSQPTNDDMQRIAEEVMPVVTSDSLLVGLSCGTLIFALIGLIAAAMALRLGQGRGWQAYLALVICVPMLGCQCIGALVGLRGGM
jgi:hypothetical protein